MKTIKEISEITGLSIRTLRYYDEIGLLKPAKLTEAGYRLYDTKALEKLQEIMFYRELEIPLADIRKMMECPGYDRQQALRAQKALLEQKRNRLNGIIELITDVMEGVNTMSFKEFTETDVTLMIEHLQNGVSEEQFQDFIQKYGGGSLDSYKKLLMQAMNDEKTKTSMLRWYGSKEKVLECQKPVSDMDALRKDLDELWHQFAALQMPDSIEEHLLAAKLAELYKQMLNLDNARAFLIDLADEYLQNDKLAEVQDRQYGEGTARYVAEAVKRYYGV